MLSFSTITRVYAYNTGLLPNQPGFYSLFKYFNLEKGLPLVSHPSDRGVIGYQSSHTFFRIFNYRL